MKKILAYPVSIIYYLAFGISLVFFHIIQIFTHRLVGYQAHKKTVDVLNFFLMRCLNILGTQIYFHNNFIFKRDKPYIIVANHQSMYDIPPIIWHLRKIHPKFISKKELGKGIPSVSYNLKYGGSVLIDRRNSKGSVVAIKKFSQQISEKNLSAVIFPEGTRSRDGKLKKFYTNGLKTLIENCPNAVVVPVSIQNSWELQKYGMFPLPLGVKIIFNVHDSIDVKEHSFEQIVSYCRTTIENGILK